MPVCVLEQCERDALKADQRDEAVDTARQSQANADRCCGALDVCAQDKQQAQRKRVWLTVGVVLLGATTVAGGVGWAVEAVQSSR